MFNRLQSIDPTLIMGHGLVVGQTMRQVHSFSLGIPQSSRGIAVISRFLASNFGGKGLIIIRIDERKVWPTEEWSNALVSAAFSDDCTTWTAFPIVFSYHGEAPFDELSNAIRIGLTSGWSFKFMSNQITADFSDDEFASFVTNNELDRDNIRAIFSKFIT